jgi:hypothetical protein
VVNNVDVAILGKVNELALRFTIDPCDFVATVKQGSTSETLLVFESMPDTKTSSRFERMLDAIGVDANGVLAGQDRQIYAALCAAISRAPSSRSK